MPLLWGTLHKLSQKLNYGLRRRKERPRHEEGPPAGPRLTRWRHRRLRSHSDRAHRQRVKLGQRLLVTLANLGLLVGSLRAMVAVDAAMLIAIAIGVGFLILSLYSRRTPGTALAIGIALYAVAALLATSWMLHYGARIGKVSITLTPFYILAFAIMIALLVGLIAGSESAQALGERVRTPENPRTPDTPM